MYEKYEQYFLPVVFLVTVIGLIYAGYVGISGYAEADVDVGHCTDSDGGLNSLDFGVCGDDYIGGLQDSCAGDNHAKEYYCTANNVCSTQNLACPEGTTCRYGKCA